MMSDVKREWWRRLLMSAVVAGGLLGLAAVPAVALAEPDGASTQEPDDASAFSDDDASPGGTDLDAEAPSDGPVYLEPGQTCRDVFPDFVESERTRLYEGADEEGRRFCLFESWDADPPPGDSEPGAVTTLPRTGPATSWLAGLGGGALIVGLGFVRLGRSGEARPVQVAP